MRKKNVWFVVNPVSGIASKESVLEAISSEIDAKRYNCKICMTRYAGHGSVLATQAAENGVDIVVAIGGDGTINEVARSLVHTNTVLGIVPCGSGNGLARHLQIPLDYRKALRLINEGNSLAIDYGLINRRPFFCTCGMGYDATVSYEFQSSKKRGLFTYIERTMKGLAKYKSEIYTIYDDGGQRSYKAFCIALANASQYGNNAYIAPRACISDGLMDVTVIEPFPVVEAPQLAFMLFSGKFRDGMNRIKTFRSPKLRIVREHSGVIHCDGEPMKAGREIDVEIVPRGIRVITNSDAKAHIEPLLQTLSEQTSTLVPPPSDIFRQASQTLLTLFRPKL